MHRLTTFLLTLAALGIALPGGLAQACDPTTSETLFELDGTYIAADPCMTTCSFFVYEEGNGIDGLQRQDRVADDTCRGMIPPDVRVF